MNEEKAMQKDLFLRETERQLRMAQVEAKLEADDLIHASRNGKLLCTVDANGICIEGTFSVHLVQLEKYISSD